MKKNIKKIAAGICAASSLFTCLTSCSAEDNAMKETDKVNTSKASQLASPVYPELPAYPVPDEDDWDKYVQDRDDWYEAIRKLQDQPSGYKDGYNEFFIKTCAPMLENCKAENPVYSPVGLYMALAMAAEVTDGNTRDQILDLLERKNIEDLRKGSTSIWQANYMDGDSTMLKIGTSLWTNNTTEYKDQTLDSLAQNYYASVFTGDPSDEGYNEMYRSWLDEQTDGLLSDYTSDMKFDPSMILNIVSTINFEGAWADKFYKENTSEQTFHAPDGDTTCEFMHQSEMMNYVKTDKLEAIELGMTDNGGVRFILPAEGYTPEDILKDADSADIFTCSRLSEISCVTVPTVNLSLPKFDVSCDNQINDCLKKLGVTDIFDQGKADFSPLTDKKELYVDNATQCARVMIDEDGCKAVAITVFAICAGAIETQETVDLSFDRPFIFEIISETGTPLFTGIINNPAA